MHDPILTLNAVGKRFPGVVALRGVSLEIARGESHVLLGENGAGKSTLINLLAGVYPADDGEIVFDRQPYRPRTPTDAYRAGIRVVHQELSMLPQMTVAENLLFESLPQRHGLVNYRETNRRAAALAGRSRSRRRADHGGQPPRRRANAARRDRQGALLREQASHPRRADRDADSKEVERLFEILRRLKARGVTILYISHRLQEIAEIGDRVTVLARRPARRDADARRTDHSRHRADDGRSQHSRTSTLFAPDVAPAGEALRVEGLRRNAKSPEVSFSVAKGEIVGVAGLVGSGRTETARALFGADPKIAGEIYVEGQRVEVSSPREAVRQRTLPDDRRPQGAGPAADMSCAENITITDLRKISRHGILERRG